MDLPNSLIKICTQFDIITAVFHRNGYTYGWLTIKVHFRFSRFSIAAFDFGNITQTEGTVISLDRNIADIGQCIRGTGQTQIGISLSLSAMPDGVTAVSAWIVEASVSIGMPSCASLALDIWI